MKFNARFKPTWTSLPFASFDDKLSSPKTMDEDDLLKIQI
jgi:hypothetical protein